MTFSSRLNLENTQKSFSFSNTVIVLPSARRSPPALHIPDDSEDSGDVPASISRSRWLYLLELASRLSAVRCSLLDQEGVCRVLSEDTEESDSSCGSQPTVCEGSFTLSSRPGEHKHRQSLMFLHKVSHTVYTACVSELTCDQAAVDWRLHLLNSTELMLFSHHLHDAQPDASHWRLRCSRRRQEA